MKPATARSPLEQLGARLHQLASPALLRDIEAIDPWDIRRRLVNNRTAYTRLGIPRRARYREHEERVIYETLYRREAPWPHAEYLYPADIVDGGFHVHVYKNTVEIHADSVTRDTGEGEFDPIREVMNLDCTLHRPSLEPLDWEYEHYVCTREEGPFAPDSARYIRVEREPRRALLAFARSICRDVFAEMQEYEVDPDVPPPRLSGGGIRPRTWSDPDNASDVGSDGDD